MNFSFLRFLKDARSMPARSPSACDPRLCKADHRRAFYPKTSVRFQASAEPSAWSKPHLGGSSLQVFQPRRFPFHCEFFIWQVCAEDQTSLDLGRIEVCNQSEIQDVLPDRDPNPLVAQVFSR